MCLENAHRRFYINECRKSIFPEILVAVTVIITRNASDDTSNKYDRKNMPTNFLNEHITGSLVNGHFHLAGHLEVINLKTGKVTRELPEEVKKAITFEEDDDDADDPPALPFKESNMCWDFIGYVNVWRYHVKSNVELASAANIPPEGREAFKFESHRERAVYWRDQDIVLQPQKLLKLVETALANVRDWKHQL